MPGMSGSSHYSQASYKSPLDQIANGIQPQQSRHAILERAVTLTRKSSARRRPNLHDEPTYNLAGVQVRDNSRDAQSLGSVVRQTSNQDNGGSSSDDFTRQRIRDLRAARLSQTSASSDASTSRSVSHDSLSSEYSSYNMTEGGQLVSHPADDSFVDHPDRIAEAIRGLSLRRRQSIDTVRSSEFGEGGRWDRAWGGSDDEDDDDVESIRMLGNIDIEGSSPNNFNSGASPRNLGDISPIPHFSSTRQAHLPALHDTSNQHTVSLTSLSKERRLPPSGHSQQPTYLGPDNLQRRDTIMSMAGDMGRVSPTPSRHQHTDSSATTEQNDWNASTRSLSSDHSQVNSHVCVWPPTPAGSELGGDHLEGTNTIAGERMLQARPSQLGRGQEAKIEYYEDHSQASDAPGSSSQQRQYPISPSAALAQTLRDPLIEPISNFPRAQMTNQTQASSRVPLHPSTRSNLAHDSSSGYSDPNKPLPSTLFGELGEARRRAIVAQDGRESLVSDLDVETLRLDGSNGSEGSRRDSISTIGSFSSEKIRDQRQRRSDATIMTNSDKRSSTDTVKDVPIRNVPKEVQHRSWNGGQRGLEPRPAIPTPKRSNTGPDASSSPVISHPSSLGTPQSTGPAVTFSTPKSNRDGKKSGVIVKGAIQQSEAEKFLTLAITHHETGDLSRSAYYFERSAKVGGGCVVGMCMWGMALREGWGVRKDQKKGFEWISRAATKAGEMMAGSQGASKSETEIKALRSELKLSVYELGKCFCYGWGVKMDKQMALEYFELAARLGDADAQAEAGALLAAGKGCKKDLKRAAAYYRMAESQGYDTVGLSWIHKAKYD